MASFLTEEQTRVKRQQVQRAQQLALAGNWDEAVAVNQEILDAAPRDVAALNRLGKALSELRRYAEAHDAYSRALALDPTNQIARRNAQRLEPLKEQRGEQSPASLERHRTQVRQSMFIEETGKSRLTELHELAPNEQLLQMASGDPIELRVEDRQIVAYSEDGIRLGRLGARLATRLIPLIEGGNRYGAAVTVAEPGLLRIIIRELYQHPSQAGRLSFPPESRPVTPRPYVRDTQRTRFLGDDQDFLVTDEDEEEVEEETEGEEDEEFTEEVAAEEPEDEQPL